MSKLVARMQKMKVGNLGGIQRHNQRETDTHSNKEIDPSRSQHNFDIIQSHPINYQKEILASINTRKKSTRAVRKDAVLVAEWIITSDTAFFDAIPKPRLNAFFIRAVDYFAEHYGLENMVYAHVHLDETTPHMHLGIIPMIDGRLTCKEIFNRQALLTIQEELPAYLTTHGYPLERGEKGSEQKNLTVPEYKVMQADLQQMAQAKEDLVPSIDDLQQQQDLETKQLTSLKGSGNDASDWIEKEWTPKFKKILFGDHYTISATDLNTLKDQSLAHYTEKDYAKGLVDHNRSLLSDNQELKRTLNDRIAEATRPLQQTIEELTLRIDNVTEDFRTYVNETSEFLTRLAQVPKEILEEMKAYGQQAMTSFHYRFLQTEKKYQDFAGNAKLEITHQREKEETQLLTEKDQLEKKTSKKGPSQDRGRT